MPRRQLGTGKREHVRHRSRIALVLIDVLNEFRFPEARQLLRGACPMARKLAGLVARFRERGLPVIYCNDNFGQWRSDRDQVIRRAVDSSCPGREVAELLIPEEDDYFVLKPKHSAFYSTTLETLLADLGTDTLVLGGMAGNICVLHTAYDAHVRGYQLVIPRDCIASNTVKDQTFALGQFRKVLDIDTRPSEQWWKSFSRGRKDGARGRRSGK